MHLLVVKPAAFSWTAKWPGYTELQWNLSIEGTIGNQLAVLYREVSLIQSVRDREVPLYMYPTQHGRW